MIHKPRKSRWLWVVLFIWLALLLGTLATGWNVVLVHDYRQMLSLARGLSTPNGGIIIPRTGVVLSMILGTLGFASALGTLILFFVRLLREMKVNQQQSDFLAAVTHELKTPIATLELTSNLLRAGELEPAEQAKLWDSHQAELVRLKEDVETLLEAARWQSETVVLKRTPIHLEAWLDDALARWVKILGPGARIERSGERLDSEIKMDVRTLNLITDNVLDNARKFARGKPRVTVRTRKIPRTRFFGKSKWALEIEDDGWGFEPGESDRIFQKFYRGRNDKAPRAIPGTGLGLFLARNASNALGITIRGESAGLGTGARFTLEGFLRKKRSPPREV